MVIGCFLITMLGSWLGSWDPFNVCGENFVVEFCEHVCMWDLCFSRTPLIRTWKTWRSENGTRLMQIEKIKIRDRGHNKNKFVPYLLF